MMEDELTETGLTETEKKLKLQLEKQSAENRSGGQSAARPWERQCCRTEPWDEGDSGDYLSIVSGSL